MTKLINFFALLSYCLLIYWLSDQPSLPTPMWFPNQDKVHHATAYFVMAILAWRGLRGIIVSVPLRAIVVLAFCSFYGVSDEWHQSFVPGRSTEFADWIADTSGALLAMILLISVKFAGKKLPRVQQVME